MYLLLRGYLRQLYDLESLQLGDAVERRSSDDDNDVAATHDSVPLRDPEIKKEVDDDKVHLGQETRVEDRVEAEVGFQDGDVCGNEQDLDDEYDSDDEEHLCSLLLYYISKTVLHHLTESSKTNNMDRFAEQFFGRPERDGHSRARPPENTSFMETFAKNLAKSAARSAAKRAMGESSGNRTRDRGGAGEINLEDFRGLGSFVLGMLNGGDEDGRKGEERKKDKKRKRDRDGHRSRGFEDEGERYASDKERRKKKRHRVTFAEPYYEFQGETYPPPYEPEPQYEPDPREHRRRSRRHHPRESREREEREERRRRRRQRRYRRELDLKTLKTELEAMSSTIISLNARCEKHRDCQFYDRFVRKGGRLQEVIGSTLGQIRGLEEGGGGDEDRKRRHRER